MLSRQGWRDFGVESKLGTTGKTMLSTMFRIQGRADNIIRGVLPRLLAIEYKIRATPDDRSDGTSYAEGCLASHFFIRNRYPSPEQVSQLLVLISPQGTTVEGMRAVVNEASDEQLNVALWVLTEQGRIWRDEEGMWHRKETKGLPRISLNALYARKRADYRRLEEVIAYCEDPDELAVPPFQGSQAVHLNHPGLRPGLYCSTLSGWSPIPVPVPPPRSFDFLFRVEPDSGIRSAASEL